MAQEEVKIFFKVDGLDEYITDLDDLKKALGNVDEATVQATKATKELEAATEAALEEEERRLNVLEGGVKVLAGSAEFAAGAFALLGDESNEFFANVEANVLGTIALGQGVIDVTEGYRLLKQNLDLSATAQKAFNLVAKANPYVVLASALIAAAGAFLLFKTRAEEAQKQVEDARKSFQKLTEDTRAAAEADIAAIEEKERLAEISETVGELTNKELQDKIALNKEQQAAAQEAIRIKKQELQDALDANAIIGAGFKSIGFVEKAQKALDEAQANYNTTLATTNTELAIYNGELDKRIEKESKVANPEKTGTLDRIEATTIDTGVAAGELITNTGLAVQTVEEDVAGFSVDQADRITNFTDVAEDTLVNFADISAQTFSTLADLNTIFTKDDEKRAKNAFEIQKKAQLAQAIIVGALAVNKAFASQVIPGDPTSLPRAIGAAALAGVQTAAQIAAISRQQFESPSPDAAGGGGGGAASINYQLGGQQAGATVTGPNVAGGGGTGGVTQAYVLAGEVTNQQEAEAQIVNLARL